MPKHKQNPFSLCSLALLLMVAVSHSAAAQTLAMPQSMNEFVNWHLDRGATGTWVDNGVTKEMWVGIPAGIRYTSTNTLIYSPEDQTLYHSQRMVTENGRVISTGTGLMYWSEENNAPMACSSGFDMGKPYTGTSTLKGIDGDSIHWEYTELSQGQSTTYSNIVKYTGLNTRTQAVMAENTSEPWVTQSVRANPGGDLMKTTNLAGTWKRELPDGSTLHREISFIADGHVLKQARTLTQKDGTTIETDLYLMYWDPVNDHIATMYLDEHGTVIHGKIDSITTEGDTVTVISSHEGSRFGGLTMSTQMTQVVTPKTLTTTFQNMSLNGIRHGLSWSESAGLSTRVTE